MWSVLLFTAFAQELPYQEVKPIPESSGGLLDASEVWVRAGGRCLPATRDDATWTVPLCERTESSGRTLTCTATLDRATPFTGAQLQFRWSDDPDAGWTTRPPVEDPPVLVQLDEDQAIWRRTFTLRPIAIRSRASTGTCTQESLEALGDRAPQDRVRRCFATEETAYVRVGEQWGGTIGIFDAGREVDCRQPCPPDPRQQWLDAEAERLSTLVFADPDAPALALYRTRELCESSTEKPLWKPGGECLQ